MSNNKKFKYYYKKPKQNTKEEIKLEFPVELLTKPISELTLSETTYELLSKNKISVCADLAMRTEKDMYKIQGLNKKILNEVIISLNNIGLSLRIINEPNQNLPKNNSIKNNVSKNTKEKDLSNIDSKNLKTNKFGLAEKTTNLSKTLQDKESISINTDTSNNELKKFIKGGKWGFIKGTKIVIPPIYDEVFLFKEELACVEINEKCGFIDLNNNVVIPIEYDLASSFSEGFAMVSKNNKCGYINKNNELVIPFLYDAATQFENGEAKVKKDGKWATIDINNNLTWII